MERVIDEIAFDKNCLIKLLTEKGLIMSATFAKEYSPTLVKEFYSNLVPAVKTLTAEGYHQVFVRGKKIEFSPEKLNNFLEFSTKVQDSVFEENFEYNDEIVKEITGRKMHHLGTRIKITCITPNSKVQCSFPIGYFQLVSDRPQFKHIERDGIVVICHSYWVSI